MLAMPAAAPFDSAAYAFEVTWDGVRALASIDRGGVRLWGRDLRDLAGRFPEVQALAATGPPDTIVDGELIVTDPEGRPDRAALEERLQAIRSDTITRSASLHPVTYVINDLLYLRGVAMMQEPLVRRRARLKETIHSSGRIYVVEPVAEDGFALFDAAREQGLDGVVAKRFDSPYRVGQRHPDWLQVDAVRREDFVVLGFIPQAGNQLLEALIVGNYDGRSFRPAGRVVGGFDAGTSVHLRKALDALPNSTAPDDSRWVDDNICWVQPRIVAAIRFSEWDQNGQLRFPIFSRLRPDVSPEECGRGLVVEPPGPVRPRTRQVQLPRLPI